MTFEGTYVWGQQGWLRGESRAWRAGSWRKRKAVQLDSCNLQRWATHCDALVSWVRSEGRIQFERRGSETVAAMCNE